jgi:hypothetical protein
VTDIGRSAVGEGKEGEVDGPCSFLVDRPKGAIATTKVRVDIGQGPTGAGMGAQVDKIETVVAIKEPDQLAARITGRTKNRYSQAHIGCSIRICG